MGDVKIKMQWEKPKVYAVKNINETVRMSSRSGGIFPALSDTILEEQGVVYGCILNEKFEQFMLGQTIKQREIRCADQSMFRVKWEIPIKR